VFNVYRGLLRSKKNDLEHVAPGRCIGASIVRFLYLTLRVIRMALNPSDKAIQAMKQTM
jgi:hypothetical protein